MIPATNLLDYPLFEGQRSLTPTQEDEFQKALTEEISIILSNYYSISCRDKIDLHSSLPYELRKLKNNNADQDEIVENMIANIKRCSSLSTCPPCDDEAEEIALKLLYRSKKILSRIVEPKPAFQGCPMSDEKRSLMECQLAGERARDLGISLEGSENAMKETTGSDGKERYGMSFNGLTNFIDTRLSSIPTDDDEPTNKEIAYSLIQRIGEMNVDPAIFNDDALYEAVLKDELKSLFGDIIISKEEMLALKDDIMQKVLEAHHRAHDEQAGQAYKQNLRDTISKVLPDQRNFSMEEQASLETLKDQLADAFIDLHYSGGNENQIKKLKDKISNEISEFCKIYLNRNPCSLINSQKLNRDLYTALMNVPLPPGDSILYEVEQARIREEINDWIREIPLGHQNPIELLARNKMIYVLSKKLFDIEIEAGDTANELMKKEIVKFLSKMPLESEEDDETVADKLIDKLRTSEKSRKYDASSHVTIDAFGNVSAVSPGSDNAADGSICPAYYKQLLEGQNAAGASKVCEQPCNKQPESFPPCILNPEDRAYLDSIKRRTCLAPGCVEELLRKNKCNASAGPRPIDAGSQTIPRPYGMEMLHQTPVCPVANEKTPRPCPGVPVGSSHQPCSQAMRTESFEIDKTHQGSLCPAAYEKIPRPCPGVPVGSSHQPCSQATRTESFEIDKTHQGSSCPAANEKTPRPCPGVPVRLSHQPCSQATRTESFGIDKTHQGSSCSAAYEKTTKPIPDVRKRSSPQPSQPLRRHTISSGNMPGCLEEVQPQIIIKQYYWNPPDESNFEETELQQNRSRHRQQTDQSSRALNSIPRDQSFMSRESRCQRPAQCQRPAPCPRSPCRPSPCSSPFGIDRQNTSPCPGFSRDNDRMQKRDGLQEQIPCSSSRPFRKERVIELGSLDDLRNPRPKKRNNDNTTEWSNRKFQDDDIFWTAPMKRVLLDEGTDESQVMEREQREERIRCKCKERLIPKCARSQSRTSSPRQPCPHCNEDGQNLNRCSRCCGLNCPYPSYLYFR